MPEPDFNRIKGNIQKMMAQNAPESDVDAYVASENVTLEQLQAAPKIGSKPLSFGDAISKLWENPPPGPSLIGFAKQLYGGATLPRDVLAGKVDINTALQPRGAFTDIPAPTEHGPGTTPGLFGNTMFAPAAAHPSDELIGRSAALAGIPTLAPTATALGSMRGGVLGSGPARAAEGVPVLADKAAKIIAQRMAADKVNPADIQTAALQAAKAGAGTITPIDLAGPNVTRLAGTAFRTGGDAAEKIANTLGARAEGQGERLSQGLTENLADPTIAYSTAENIAKSRAAAAKTAYNDAYGEALDTTSPSYHNILGLLETDAGQAAMKKAATIISNEERSPKFQPFTVDKQTGEISLTQPPDTRTLRYVLRGLDDVIDANKVDAGFGKNKLTQLGGTVQGVKEALRSELFTLNPKFKAANNAYASASEMRSAIDTGMDFLGKPAEVIASEMSGLSDSAKEMYRLGAARALQGKIGRMMPESDKTSGLRSPEFNKQLAAIFPDQATLERTQALIQYERTQAQRKNAIIGGSQTAERQATDAQSLQGAIGTAKDIATANVKGLVGRGVDWYVKNKLGLNDPKVASEVANLLTTGINDPKAFAEAMKRIQVEYRQLRRTPK